MQAELVTDMRVAALELRRDGISGIRVFDGDAKGIIEHNHASSSAK